MLTYRPLPRQASGTALSRVAADLSDLAADLGYVDVQMLVRGLQQLAPSESASRFMVEKGLRAISDAERVAINVAAMPGEVQKRAVIRSRLEWYSSGKGNYAGGFWDIRDWTIKAFIALNAAIDSNESQKRNEGLFYEDAWDGLKAFPKQVIGGASGIVSDTVGGTLKNLLGGLFSNPVTAIALGLAALVGLSYVKRGLR